MDGGSTTTGGGGGGSQINPLTSEDWRAHVFGNVVLPHSIHELPEDIRKKILSMMKNLGLRFGCIDMILTPEKEYVFIEVNPNGQWLWVQDFTGMQIDKAIARYLYDHSNS